jgi:serine phosphatase RsbU (regulator of sigma subunit)
MRTQCIALITDASPFQEIPHWWEPMVRAWPDGLRPPRLEPITPHDVARLVEEGKAHSHWDAAVLALVPPLDETIVCHVLDSLQQAMIPVLLLVADPNGRMDNFHSGAVVVRPLDTSPVAVAAMLYALAARQTAVRALEQNLTVARSYQGETAAEIDRLHQELLLAARVQRDFMPKQMPEVEGLEASVLFRPAGFVSGDTYDVARLDEHHVGFFLADAMGHGVPAALMTLYLTGSLPRKEITSAGYRIIPPSEALGRLNNGLQECMAGPARFATAIYGVADTRTGCITMACAGHPPPLRIGPHGVRPVEVSGMLLGVVANFEYEQVTIRLDDNELLVLHSDGIESAFSPRHTAHSDIPTRPAPPHYSFLANMRRGESLRDLPTAMSRLAREMDAQSGSLSQEDDQTVLSLRTRPTAAREPGEVVGVGVAGLA